MTSQTHPPEATEVAGTPGTLKHLLHAKDALATSMHTVEEWSDSALDRWCARAFAHQYHGSERYRRWCETRGVTPESIVRWQDVPPVPAEAFKHFDFVAPEGHEPEAVFRTSGTTAGSEARGRHNVLSLDLYRHSMMGPMKSALLPDDDGIDVVSLIPHARSRPDSSLSVMASEAAAAWGSGCYWLVDAEGAYVRSEIERWLDRHSDEPVLILSTALALFHALAEGGPLPTMPEGSRLMETGGFKGATRSISRDELYARVEERWGLGQDRIVNEYGMTELLSQLWEPILHDGPSARGRHRPAPWLRVRALDPTTLREVPEGETGVLAFFDVANYGSVSHILTQDLGQVVDGDVRLQGRVLGAEPRGCSRTMDDLMASQISS
ncbi:MAG: hypothetical protein AAF389_15570 [Gemmatimonadota bacterium]